MHPLAAQAVDIGILTTSVRVCAGETLVHGWAFIESTGAASAIIELWDGLPDTGQLLAPISLSAGQSTRDWLAGGGIGADSGVVARVTSGSVKGSVWIVPAERIADYAFGLGEQVRWAGSA